MLDNQFKTVFTVPRTGDSHTTLQTPEQWQDFYVGKTRHKKWHGFFDAQGDTDGAFSNNFQLRYINDRNGRSYDWIKKIYDTYGVDERITITIYQSHGNQLTTIFDGVVRLVKSRFGITEGKRFAEIFVNDSSVWQSIKRLLDTPVDLFSNKTINGYDLPVYAKNPYLVTLKPKTISQVAKGQIYSDFVYDTQGTGGDVYVDKYVIDIPKAGGDRIVQTIFGIQFGLNATQTELHTLEEVANISKILAATDDASPEYINNFFTFSDGGDYRINLDLNIQGSYSGFRESSVQVSYNDVSCTVSLILEIDSKPDTILYSTTTDKYLDNFNIAVNDILHFTAIDVGATGRLYVKLDLNAHFHNSNLINDLNAGWEIKDCTIKGNSSYQILSDTTYPETTARCVPLHEALARTLDVISDGAISNGTLGFRSTYYGRTNAEPMPETPYTSNGVGAFRVTTNGYNIRNIAGKGLTYNFTDLMDSLVAIDGVGCGLEKDSSGKTTLVVEKRSYFYQDNPGIRLTRIPSEDIILFPRELSIFNKIEVGYDKTEVLSANVLDEFNSKRTYTTGKTEGTTFSILSSFVSSGYALEYTRRLQPSNAPTEDWKYDANNFIICVNRDVDHMDYNETNEHLSNAQGLLDPSTIYNADLNPSRMLKRNLDIIQESVNVTQIDKNSTWQMNWSEGYEIAGVYSQDNNVDGSDAIDFSLLDSSNVPFKRENISINIPITPKDWKQLDINPYSYITIKTGTDSYLKIYIDSIKYDMMSMERKALITGYTKTIQ